MQNVITREISIHAPKERVYEAITDIKQIVLWFPTAVEGTLAVGDRPIFDFGNDGKNQIYVEAAQPYEYFAYRWIPGSEHFIGDVLARANTLVEFRIEEKDGNSQVTLTESGFAALPTEIAEQCFRDNSGGWDYMLARLQKYLQ